VTDELNCIITEEDAKYCHHALKEICENYAGADKKFAELKQKFEKLGYTFDDGSTWIK